MQKLAVTQLTNIVHIFNGAVIWTTASQDGRFLVRVSYSPWKFSSDLFILSAFSRYGVHSASDRNEYEGTSLRVKCGRAYSGKLCGPSSAKCQSKNGGPTFHPSLSLHELLLESFAFY
jgi:hypothetical protein